MHTILLIDDDPDFLDILTTVLETAKFVVRPISSAVGAVKKLLLKKPDAIVVDYDMPGMDGLQFAQEVRRHPQLAAIPIIIMSAHRHASQLANESGADMFLAKPFDTHALISSLQKLIGKKK